MTRISNEAELKASIRELELRTMQQEKALKDNAKLTAKSFQPANLIKTGLINAQKVAMSRDVKTVALTTFLGLAAGYVTRRFVIGRNGNIFRRTLGVVVQTAITKMVYKNIPSWKRKTAKFISNYNNHKSKRDQIDHFISN